MNPLEILKQEHSLLRKEVLMLEEMTFSPSVNTRDFCDLFKNLFRLWDSHEHKEDKIFRILHQSGFEIPIEQVLFDHGKLASYKKAIIGGINSANETTIKNLIKTTCGNLVDILRAHIFTEEIFLNKIDWNKLNRDTIQKIELLQIIPSEDLV